ncbi:hypothetical protein, partial [Pseudomonas graminis]
MDNSDGGNIMNKGLLSFPLKPLVIALAVAQSFAVLADPAEPLSIIDSTYPSSARFIVQTGTLTINSDASIATLNGNALTNNQLTLMVDNNGILSTQNYGSALVNQGTIELLRNGQTGEIVMASSGTLSSGSAIENDIGATISELNNSGLIDSGINMGFSPSSPQTRYGIANDGTITTLNNYADGTISGFTAAIVNTGTLTTLNNDGIIKKIEDEFFGTTNGDAIANYGVLGAINNSGTIIGNITNGTSNELVINGGENRRGSLIGNNPISNGATSSLISTPVGTINSTGADVRFQKGQLLLNDNVMLGGNHTLINKADVLVNQNLIVDGNYHQTANAILNIGVADGSAIATGSTLDVGYGRLNVTGTALVDSGSTIRLVNNGNYGFAYGQRYLVINAASAGTEYNEQTLHYIAENFNGTVNGQLIYGEETKGLALYLKENQPDNGGDNSGGGNSGGGNTPVIHKPLPTTGNAISSLNGLSGYNGFSPGLLNLFNASKTITTEAESNRIGEQLSPGQNSMASAATSAASMDALGV